MWLKKQLKFGPLPIHLPQETGSHKLKTQITIIRWLKKISARMPIQSFWNHSPLKPLKIWSTSSHPRKGEHLLCNNCFKSLLFLPYISPFLPLSFFFSAWLLQLPPGWGCSSNPNKTPFFSYWPSWHVMENQANYPYSCFHLLFM